MGSGNIPRRYRELTHRVSNGVEVILFWQTLTNELKITVCDERSGTYFEIGAAPHEALDVFNHPYAHAAFRGLSDAEAAPPPGPRRWQAAAIR